MMKEPLVSIVVNNYNYERYVGDAIQSALNQTYNRIEVVVVDDGSTDNSRSVINRYRGDVKIVFKSNGGQASAFNAGYSTSTGKLVQFLDADDFIDRDCIERLLEAWEDDLSSIQFRLRLVDEEGMLLPSRGTMPGKVALSGQRSSLLRYGNYSYTSTTGNLYSRRFLEVGLPVPHDRFRICADTYLQSTVPFTGRVKGLMTIHGAYRIHGSNAYYCEGRTSQPAKMRAAIVSAELRSELVAEWAAKYKLNTAPRIGDRELHMLALRSINLKLYGDTHPIPRDTQPRLLLWALLCMLSEARRLDIRSVMYTLGKIVTSVCLPKAFLQVLLDRKHHR